MQSPEAARTESFQGDPGGDRKGPRALSPHCKVPSWDGILDILRTPSVRVRGKSMSRWRTEAEGTL